MFHPIFFIFNLYNKSQIYFEKQMKRILTKKNSVVLQEISNSDEITLQLGYSLGGITYKIDNGNVKFYLKNDYFYKNCIFSADLPLNIDGKEYDADTIAEALGDIFATGGGGGGAVSSVNGKTGNVVLTAEDVDAYTKGEVDGLIDGIQTDIDGINEELDSIEETIGGYNDAISGLQDDVENLEQDFSDLETTVREHSNRINQNEADIAALQTASSTHLVASNIKAGTNIAVSVSGNDVTVSTVGIPTSEALEDLEEQVDANTTAIEGIQQELTNQEHFRGYFATNNEIQSLTGKNGDFAYSAQSGTKWAYNNSWADTHEAVPDKTVEKSTTVPLMDGTATIGTSNKYAAADHIHPTDTSRASQSDLTALSTQVQSNTTAIGNKANQSDLNALTQTVNGHTTAIQAETTRAEAAESALRNSIPTVPTNVSAFTNDAGYLTQHQSLDNYYTKSEVDDAIDNVEVDLSNYYTKSESNSRFALKFTDVDDIQLVSQLPLEPDARTLYLIPSDL